MPILFQYLLKLSVSLGIMYLFYQFVLRRLTFYNHNRWYLIGYSLLCFFISFINISPILEKNEVVNHEIVTFIPAVEMLTTKVSPDPASAMGLGHWTSWSWLLLFLIAGTGIMFLRFVFQLISFKKLTGKARLIADNEIKFYQVNENIIPFSFGNSIFINQHLHTETELKEIIRHEFVHVKQRHTVDIIWSEILCILNWYNPFAWLIRKAIRQNLEFIADNKVLENGMDKKQYQYLLLKVIGNNHFSIASNFNFSSLKKRIAMMNKIRSAKVHLIKFLFVLPLMAVLLLSFREIVSADSDKRKENFTGVDTIPAERKQEIVEVRPSFSLHRNDKMSQGHKDFFLKNPDINLLHWKANGGVEIYFREGKMKSYDTVDELKSFENKHGELPQPSGSATKRTSVTKSSLINARGYYIDIEDNRGNCTVAVKDKNRKEVKRLLLTEWNEKEKYYEELYGEIPSSPKNNDIKKTDTNPENEEVLIQAKIGDYLFTAQTIIVKDKRRNGGIDSVSIINFPSGANDLSLTDFNGLVLVNGIEVAGEELKKIKPDEIVEISIYKSKSALKEYGEKGKNGVIIITTKKEVTDDPQTPVIKIRGKAGIADNAVYYVNGKETSKEAVEFIDPAKIQSINVLKGKAAEQKYGDKGKNGIIEITIPDPAKINFIEKPITPARDIKNVLPVKKDEC